MTIQQLKSIIRQCKNLPDLMELVRDHDRLERENAELRGDVASVKADRSTLLQDLAELRAALEVATAQRPPEVTP